MYMQVDEGNFIKGSCVRGGISSQTYVRSSTMQALQKKQLPLIHENSVVTLLSRLYSGMFMCMCDKMATFSLCVV